jgi:hypothetical protein
MITLMKYTFWRRWNNVGGYTKYPRKGANIILGTNVGIIFSTIICTFSKATSSRVTCFLACV